MKRLVHPVYYKELRERILKYSLENSELEIDTFFVDNYKAHPIQAFFIPKYANAIPMYFHLHFFLFRTKFVI